MPSLIYVALDQELWRHDTRGPDLGTNYSEHQRRRKKKKEKRERERERRRNKKERVVRLTPIFVPLSFNHVHRTLSL